MVRTGEQSMWIFQVQAANRVPELMMRRLLHMGGPDNATMAAVALARAEQIQYRAPGSQGLAPGLTKLLEP